VPLCICWESQGASFEIDYHLGWEDGHQKKGTLPFWCLKNQVVSCKKKGVHSKEVEETHAILDKNQSAQLQEAQSSICENIY
jgi:hypothetical protein